jgi:polyphosphate kinase
MEISERVLFRVTRDADFEVSDDADDLLEAVESELRRRRFGDVVRVEVSASASSGMLDRLREGLAVHDDQIYEIEGLLDLADLMQLTRLDRPDLKPEPWVPVTQPRLSRAKDAGRLFDEIRRGDLLVHQPYESFRTSFEAFAAAAADDPDVIAMKTAVYRTSDDSTLVSALVDCAEDGKQAVCLVELKARFDERRNIEWSRELEQAGVHVVHGFPDMKIHAKMTLVVRREAGGLRRYVHIGTGNYHAATARLYEDVGIFTADEEIAADVADVFNYVTGFGRPQRFRKLLVAPFELRARVIEEIRTVAAAAKAGETARIRLKLNNLVDPKIIDELYAASTAGAKVEICARSICMIRPGVEDLSENITVRSILGRFLEHSRIYSFEAGDSTAIFIGSADMMPRNLDRRVEVLVPVESARSRQELQAILGSVFADDVHAWLLSSDGSWSRVEPEKSGKRIDHQAAMMKRAQLRARRQTDTSSSREKAL